LDTAKLNDAEQGEKKRKGVLKLERGGITLFIKKKVRTCKKQKAPKPSNSRGGVERKTLYEDCQYGLGV